MRNFRKMFTVAIRHLAGTQVKINSETNLVDYVRTNNCVLVNADMLALALQY